MKSLDNLISDFSKAKDELEKLHKSKLPRIVGNEAVKVVKNNFTIGGYDSGTGGVDKWKPREPSTDKAYDRRYGVKGSVYSSQNPLMLQTRNNYNAVKYAIANLRVNIGVNLQLVPYAEFTNQARKYIPANGEPANPKILKAIEKKYLSEREKVMGNFKR